MSDWPRVSFSTLYASPSKNGIMAPSRTRGQGTALINMGEIFAYERIGAQEMELAPIPGKHPQDWLVQQGDLLFARQSLKFEGAGKCVLVLDVSIPRTFESHLIRVRLDTTVANPAFYFYYFMSPAGRDNMYSIIEQVAAAGIRSTDLARLLVPKPPLPEQNRIAEALAAVDEKVASNERATRIGQQLLRSMVTNALETSNGAMGQLSDYCEVIRTPARIASFDGTQHYVGLEHIPRGSLFLDTWSSSAGLGSDKSAFVAGDVLFGKLRPYFKKVGIAPVDGICSTDVLVIRPSRANLVSLVATVCGSDALIEHVTSTSTGTRMPRASWADIGSWPVPNLSSEEQANLAAMTAPIADRFIAMARENRRLLEFRAFLLGELFEERIIMKQELAA